MRVVHVTTTLVVGGAERLLVDVARAQQASGLEVAVVELGPPGPLGAPLRAAGIPVHPVALGGLADAPGALRRLTALLRGGRPVVVHTWMFHANALGGLAARAARVPRIVWSLHATAAPRRGRSRRARCSAWLGPWLARLAADVVICTSAVTRDEAGADGYPPGRLALVRNAVPPADTEVGAVASLRGELGLPADAPLIGHLGRLDPQKDHATLLAAFALLARQRDGLHLVLCGRGVDRADPAPGSAVAASGVAERIHLLGERDDAARIQRAVDVVVSSSAYGETAPLAVLEAMVQGTPVVTTDVGDCAEVVGATGRVVPPGEPDALAEAVGQLLGESAAAREQRGLRARRRVAERFAFDDLLAAYVELYRDGSMGRRRRSDRYILPFPNREATCGH